jgi:hypothetical protein
MLVKYYPSSHVGRRDRSEGILHKNKICRVESRAKLSTTEVCDGRDIRNEDSPELGEENRDKQSEQKATHIPFRADEFWTTLWNQI